MSGGYVWYHLRPNKAVERQLFVELLGKLNRYVPISEYCYVSFGGAYLEDFKLVHSQFANTKMISIEEDANVFERQKFNLPHACIKMENCTSGEFITDKLDENEKNIIWLDYAEANKTYTQITELQSLLSKSNEYDIVKVTLNANPNSLFDSSNQKPDGKRYTIPELNEIRLQKLIDRIGEFIPNDTRSDDMAKDKYPLVLNRAIGIASTKIISGIDQNLRFQPLASFYYGDSDHQMVTVTGIVIQHDEIKKMLDVTGLGSWELASIDWGKSQSIQLPALTAREKFALDQRIPSENIENLNDALGFIFDKKRESHDAILINYQKYYRYYPSFHKVVY